MDSGSYNRNPLQTCPFAGNADLYGIGIRIGFYLQWISTLLATIFTPWEEDILRVLNLLVQSAVFLGLILLTRDYNIRAVEPVITIWLLFGALSSLSGSGMNPLGRLSGFFRILLYSGVAGYACWFWFSGLDELLEAELNCKTVAFFGEVPIDGPFRMFNKVVSVMGGTICVVFLLWSVAIVRKRIKGRGITTRVRRPSVEMELLFFSFAIIVLSIAAVEYLLTANLITDINNISSVGQLLPLVSGILGFIQVSFSVLRKKLYLRPRCLIFFGHHLS